MKFCVYRHFNALANRSGSAVGIIYYYGNKKHVIFIGQTVYNIKVGNQH